MNKKGIKIAIGVLTVIALCLSGILGYRYFVNTNEKNNLKEESKEYKKENEENQKEELLFTLTQSDEEIISELISLVSDYDKDNLKVSELSNEDKTRFGLRFSKESGPKFSGKSVRDAYKKYFNDEVELTDIYCRDSGHKVKTASFIYNKETDMYETNPEHGGHGGSSNGLGHIERRQSLHVYENNKIVIKNEVLFTNSHKFSSCTIGPDYCEVDVYKTYKDSKNNENVLFNAKDKNACGYSSNELVADYDRIYREGKGQGSVYSYNFEKVNGNIVFVSYTKEK